VEDEKEREGLRCRRQDFRLRDDELTDVTFSSVSPADLQVMSELVSVDAAWLAARILSVPYALGRRRLDTLLFAQRVFGGAPDLAAAEYRAEIGSGHA
jgi:hypothetical protein